MFYCRRRRRRREWYENWNKEMRGKKDLKKKKKAGQAFNHSIVCPHAHISPLPDWLTLRPLIRTILLLLQFQNTGGDILVLLREEILEPSVFHLQLGNTCLERGVQLGGFPHSALELLFALFLLGAEPCAGGGVAPSLVFLGGEAGLFLCAEGSGNLLPRGGRAVFCAADSSVGWGD